VEYYIKPLHSSLSLSLSFSSFAGQMFVERKQNVLSLKKCFSGTEELKNVSKGMEEGI